MAYSAITSGEVDQESPVTEGLMQKIRNNQEYHEDQFDASTGHNHDGDTDDGAPIDTFPENVTAQQAVTVEGTLTAPNFINWGAMFGLW